MDETMRKNKAAAYRMLAMEAGITGVLMVLLYIAVNIETAYSAALGGVKRARRNASLSSTPSPSW